MANPFRDTVNLVFAQYSDNPIVAKLVRWPPDPHGVRQVRACCPLLRKPFIEIEYLDGQSSQQAFGKQGFMRFWQEAEVLLEDLTNISIVKEFVPEAMKDRDSFSKEVRDRLKQSIAESYEIFDGGRYQLFLDQYGANCKSLPAEVCERIAKARQKLVSEANG